jgi:hypothetical protein
MGIVQESMQTQSIAEFGKALMISASNTLWIDISLGYVCLSVGETGGEHQCSAKLGCDQ